MASDNNSELLALMSDLIQATSRQAEELNYHFERLTKVAMDGFRRLEEKIDGTNTRLGHLTKAAQQPSNVE